MLKIVKRLAAAPAALLIMTSAALASTGGGGGGLPGDGPITTIEGDLQGTVAHAFIIMAIVVTGLMWAFGEHGTSMRKVMGIAAGGSIALGAASFISGLGLGAGAVIGGAAGGDSLLFMPVMLLVSFTLLAVMLLVRFTLLAVGFVIGKVTYGPKRERLPAQDSVVAA